MNTVPEFSDIQGIVRFGYHRLTAACFYLLEVADAALAREWLRRAPVTDATERDPPPQTALQVALTAAGLQALATPDDVIAGFSAEFLAGMAGNANRSHRLGDMGSSDPTQWQWGGPEAMPHVLVMVYATAGRFEAWKHEVTGDTFTRAFRVMDCLTTKDLDGREPFGFADGISQPTIDWERRETFDAIEASYREFAKRCGLLWRVQPRNRCITRVDRGGGLLNQIDRSQAVEVANHAPCGSCPQQMGGFGSDRRLFCNMRL